MEESISFHKEYLMDQESSEDEKEVACLPRNEVYPLANPKGVKFLCELCKAPATIQCSQCKVTYYCDDEHQRTDWDGIHRRVCTLLAPLRQEAKSPIPFMGAQEQMDFKRAVTKAREADFLTLTRTVGQKLLFKGKPADAVPAALQSLHSAIDIYGKKSVELVPSYLILAEASIGLHRLNHAKRYLSQAEWTVLQQPDCPRTIRHRLHRCLGQCHFAQGNYYEARRELSQDVLYASMEYGTHDVRTSGGYYHLARTFYKMGDIETAEALFRQVCDIWVDHLGHIVRTEMNKQAARKKRLSDAKNTDKMWAKEVVDSKIVTYDETDFTCLDEAQQAEIEHVMTTIYRLGEVLKKQEYIARSSHGLAMLYFLTKDRDTAVELARRASASCPKDEAFSGEISQFLRMYLKDQKKRHASVFEDCTGKLVHPHEFN